MNIAMFTDSFFPQINGVISAVVNLSKGLADRGHKVYIIAPYYDKKHKEFKHPNIKILRMPSKPAFFYEGFRVTSPYNLDIMHYLSKQNIDIVHFHTPFTIGAESILFAKINKKPLVGTFHTFISNPQYLKHIKVDYKFMQKISWKYSNLFYNQCNLITCPSESTKKELIKNNAKKTIKVISNGIDFSIFDNKYSKKIKERYNLNGKLLLFVGRIAYEKNITYLLDCFKMVVNKIPSTKLIIIGDGPQKSEVKKQIKKLKLSNNVIMTGKIDYSKLVKSGIFGACDIFVTASTTETQGISTLEAQANGLVCIGIYSTGIKDLIKNNYNGYLVKQGDKQKFANSIIKLLTNEKVYKKMRKVTLENIKKHDIKNVISEWETTYSKLIREHKIM